MEGVDIFIPSKNIEEPTNTYDIDIKPEAMNQDTKEVFNALNEEDDFDEDNILKNNKQEDNIYEELEDDFIILANDGKLPIEFLPEKNTKSTKSEQNQANSSYKYITKEEKEYLMSKFKKEEEEEYEDYEVDEEGEYDELEENNEEEYEDDEDSKEENINLNQKNKNWIYQ